jgi:hypothetical protein
MIRPLQIGFVFLAVLFIAVAWTAGKIVGQRLAGSQTIAEQSQSANNIKADEQAEIANKVTASNINNDLDEIPLAMRNDIDYLREEVDSARKEREKLIAELDALQLQVDQISNNDAQADGSEANPDGGGLAGVTGGRNRAARASDGFGFGPMSDEQRIAGLVAAGVDAQTISTITQKNDEYELARLDLIDRASREGWRRSEEFRDEINKLDDERVDIRSEIGESAYDTYLYESGRSNRVAVESIINGSAAQLAGVEVSDVVVSYDNQLIFTTRELQQATRTGNRGETIEITVRRVGSGEIPFSIIRGPLGVTLSAFSEQP